MDSAVSGPPLRAVILSRTGEDVRLCQACDQCECLLAEGMDLTFGEMFRLAARDDLRALTCASLWRCEPLLGRNPTCQAGLDIPAVIGALRTECLRRRLGPPPAHPEWIL